MEGSFYPFVSANSPEMVTSFEEIHYPTRIAVWDDPAVTPRVVVVEPKDVRSYLEEITQQVNTLSHEQGGNIPFMIIREIVENFIHAYFISPTVSIFNNGNTIRFSDQGPGIAQKDLALEYGTTSATEEMKHYIRGVGSGLPLASQYMRDKGGSLTLSDNISNGLVVTISLEDPVLQENAVGVVEPQHENIQARSQVGSVEIGEREGLILSYLQKHDSVGPSELTVLYGGSQPTWSRELKSLDNKGFLIKRGQKRYLTDFGLIYLQKSSQG